MRFYDHDTKWRTALLQWQAPASRESLLQCQGPA